MKKGVTLAIIICFLLFGSLLNITAQTSQADEEEEGFLYTLLSSNPFKMFLKASGINLFFYPFEDSIGDSETLGEGDECQWGVMCDDGDPCTLGSCEHGSCVYYHNEGDPDCVPVPDETDPCLIDPASCEDPEDVDPGTIDPGEIGCISDSMGCNDEDVCTQDECDSSGNCINLPIPGCVDPITGCSDSSHCDDADPCTRDSCNNGACSHDSLGDKCDPDAEDEEDPEETDPCVLDPASCKNPGDGDEDEDYCTANPTSPNCIDEYCTANPNNPACDPNYRSEDEDESDYEYEDESDYEYEDESEEEDDTIGVEEALPEIEEESENIFEVVWDFFKGWFD